jgi:hypothetical protein
MDLELRNFEQQDEWERSAESIQACMLTSGVIVSESGIQPFDTILSNLEHANAAK